MGHLWGIFHYGEIRKGNAVIWCVCATMILTSMVLLGFLVGQSVTIGSNIIQLYNIDFFTASLP